VNGEESDPTWRPTQRSTPDEDVFATSDPGDLDESVTAARRMMAEVTTYYPEVTP